MWIISKSTGLFNVRNFSHFYEDSGVTYGYSESCNFVVSMAPILDRITEAIKRGYPFLEVE